jgi:hypothetical protein
VSVVAVVDRAGVFAVAQELGKAAVFGGPREISLNGRPAAGHVRSVRRLNGAKWDSSTEFDGA